MIHNLFCLCRHVCSLYLIGYDLLPSFFGNFCSSETILQDLDDALQKKYRPSKHHHPKPDLQTQLPGGDEGVPSAGQVDAAPIAPVTSGEGTCRFHILGARGYPVKCYKLILPGYLQDPLIGMFCRDLDDAFYTEIFPQQAVQRCPEHPRYKRIMTNIDIYIYK